MVVEGRPARVVGALRLGFKRLLCSLGRTKAQGYPNATCSCGRSARGTLMEPQGFFYADTTKIPILHCKHHSE